jgi:hypothetical protein
MSIAPADGASVMPEAVRVDFVAKVENGKWLLVLVESGPWEPPYDDKLRDLQGRIYDCIDVALDGELAKRFPESKGCVLSIRVDCYDICREVVEPFFERISSGIFQIPEYFKALQQNPYVASVCFEIAYYYTDLSILPESEQEST